jgi:small redox-active disulfide protein 2
MPDNERDFGRLYAELQPRIRRRLARAVGEHDAEDLTQKDSFVRFNRKEGGMKIQVAGPGCPRCQATEKNVFNACAALNLDADISHVYDTKEFVTLGVRFTPAVIVDGKIVVSGKVPTVGELKSLLSKSG